MLDSDGELWMSGLGYAGQLGTGGREDMLTPTLVPKEQFGGARVKMAACGAFHTLVLTEVGRVWAFGCGEDGQLGHAATPLGAWRTGSWVSPISSWPQKP